MNTKIFGLRFVLISIIFSIVSLCIFSLFQASTALAVESPTIKREKVNDMSVSQPSQGTIETSTPKDEPTTSEPVTPTPSAEVIEQQGEVSSSFTVTTIEVAATSTSEITGISAATSITFYGKAEPNSEVTLYIFSTPIVVTVATDVNGDWSYTLDQELEDGDHTLYVAKVDESGTILARSEPIFFTKVAEAVTLNATDPISVQPENPNFFRQYFLMISLAILVVAIVAALMIVGRRGNNNIPPTVPPINPI